jgi:hypothetical protein
MQLTLEGNDQVVYYRSEVSDYRHFEAEDKWERWVGAAWVQVSETVELDRAANDVVRAEGLLFRGN